MDSGNSGSLQSSSGGDGDGAGVNHPSPLFHPTPILQPSSNFFDPSSFSQPPNPNPNSMYDLDSLWSRNPTPNPIHNLDVQKDPYLNSNPVDNNTEKLGAVTKNPKKRTRASRRAPTTVLTTDTTNFRQMVQEFTGIPAAPFATSSSASFTRRLDLYGMAPLKPSAQKAQAQLQQQPLYLNRNFQLPPSETHGLTKQPLNLSNLQNQMFPFQSVTQSTLPQQVNVTEHPDAFVGSSSRSLKRWRGQDENLGNFEGRSGNSQNVVVSMRNDGDQHQLPGNEDSWICPSD